MGLGHFGGGVAAARWLAEQGALVTVTDLADETVLADSVSALADVPIHRFRLGSHCVDDFRRADLIVVNPAVKPQDGLLRIAQEARVRLTSEIELFLERCPARIVGVTGSNGKSTTAAMTAAILQAEQRTTWLGGNIGNSLLDKLGQITSRDSVVLELSSFQLQHVSDQTRMPEIAVVTNCSPNHLHWHGSFERYQAAKQRILTGQNVHDMAVLNTADEQLGSWTHLIRGRRVPLIDRNEIPPLSVPGEHNRLNAICAATAAVACGCGLEAVRRGLAEFSPLVHRLEPVGLIAGRRLFNDSSATTPESTIAAIDALGPKLWLLAGGSDKGIDFNPLAGAIAGGTCGAAFYGSVRKLLYEKVVAQTPDFSCTMTQTMSDGLLWCWQRSQPGEVILLSPACASHDQFRNFKQRGEIFKRLVVDGCFVR